MHLHRSAIYLLAGRMGPIDAAPTASEDFLTSYFRPIEIIFLFINGDIANTNLSYTVKLSFRITAASTV
jgi:hypothetical protein